MKSILLAFLSVLSISLNAQETVSDIKSNSFEIKGKLNDGFYKQDTSQLNNLVSVSNSLVSKSCYLDFEPEYYETDNLIKYNTDTRNFSVLNEIEGGSFYNETGYIQFDRILFKCPTGILTTSRNVNRVCYAFIEEAISFKIDNDSLALKIRENCRDLRLLFVFSLTGTKPFQNASPDLTSANYYLMASLDRVIVYNTKTNEIFSTYK